MTLKGETSRIFAYRSPIAKTDAAKSFFLNIICSLHTQGIGRIRTAKSDAMLKTPLAFSKASAS